MALVQDLVSAELPRLGMLPKVFEVARNEA